MTEEAGAVDVINTLKTLRGVPEVVESACAVLVALSVEGTQ